MHNFWNLECEEKAALSEAKKTWEGVKDIVKLLASTTWCIIRRRNREIGDTRACQGNRSEFLPTEQNELQRPVEKIPATHSATTREGVFGGKTSSS